MKQPFGMTDNIYEGENKMSDKFTCSVCGCDDIKRILAIEEVLYCLDCMTNRVEQYESIENKNAELIKENELLRDALHKIDIATDPALACVPNNRINILAKEALKESVK
jgi:hypothetical protein